MKTEDMKTKTVDELQKLLMDARKEQFNQRFQRSNGTLENTAAIRKTRRTISRIKTFLSQKNDKNTAAPKAKKETAAKKPAAKKKTTKAA